MKNQKRAMAKAYSMVKNLFACVIIMSAAAVCSCTKEEPEPAVPGPDAVGTVADSDSIRDVTISFNFGYDITPMMPSSRQRPSPTYH